MWGATQSGRVSSRWSIRMQVGCMGHRPQKMGDLMLTKERSSQEIAGMSRPHWPGTHSYKHSEDTLSKQQMRRREAPTPKRLLHQNKKGSDLSSSAVPHIVFFGLCLNMFTIYLQLLISFLNSECACTSMDPFRPVRTRWNRSACLQMCVHDRERKELCTKNYLLPKFCKFFKKVKHFQIAQMCPNVYMPILATRMKAWWPLHHPNPQ